MDITTKIVDFSLKQKLLAIIGAVLICVFGIFSFKNLPIDAFPDVTPTLVQVFTETEGLAPEEVEKLITYPVEVSMNGLPDLKQIRSVSNFGLSIVNVYFEDGVDIYFARQLVQERLTQAKEALPEGLGEPAMGPITTGMGQILFYYLDGPNYGQKELRTIQDWIIKFNLQTLPGVTEILSIGGEVKQYQVLVDPNRMIKWGLSLHDIVEAVEENNLNVGASFLEKGEEEFLVRSVGLVETKEDLEGIVVKTEESTPIFLRDVAKVEFGAEINRGTASRDGIGEIVVGFILKLFGENTQDVISSVKTRIGEINKILPEGVTLIPYYDQADLVEKCVSTVKSSLFQGIVLVTLVLFFFMGNIRSALIVVLSLPFSILWAFICMRYMGISANLMSLGGLAIGIGMMVDAAIVIVENVYRFIEEKTELEKKDALIKAACHEVSRPIFFAISIIIIVFLPLFTLQGVEGKMFTPLAYTISFAMVGSLVFSLALAPALSSLLIKLNGNIQKENFIISTAKKVYEPLLRQCVDHKKIPLIITAVLLGLGLITFPFLGKEFIPKLNEGDMLVRATMAPSISLKESVNVVNILEKEFLKFDEVKHVISRIGRGEVGAHADPVNNSEIFIELKEEKEWKRRISSEKLVEEMSEKVGKVPGVQLNFSQPIAVAVDELVSGVKAQLAIKLFGSDLEILKKSADEIKEAIEGVRGVADLQVDQVTGQPQVQIIIDREKIARYGINVSEVQELVKVAIGGEEVGLVYEGQKQFAIFARFQEEFRRDIKAIKNLLVDAPGGQKIPLDQLAEIKTVVGPRQISRENNQRFITIQCNVRGRDIGTFVEEAQKKVEDQVDLPVGYILHWGGQFELQQQANKRLSVVVPVTLLLIFLLLFMSFNSLKMALLILLNIPLSLVGGIISLKLFNLNLSVPASIGFIALFGIAIENGLVMVTYFNEMMKEGFSIHETVIKGAMLRLRPVLMTALTTGLGLLPLVFSSGTGSEIQRPLAVVVIGGLFTSTFLTLLALPAFYGWFVDKKHI